MDVASRLAQIDLDERLTQLGVHDKDRAGIAAMVRHVQADADDRATVQSLVDEVLLPQIGHWFDYDQGPGFPDSTKQHPLGAGALPAVALIAVSDDVHTAHLARGIDPALSWRSLSDFGHQVAKHRWVYGQVGLHNQNWLRNIFCDGFLWLDRLEFELSRWTVDGKPEAIVNVHIPDAGPLNPAVVASDFARAGALFEKYYPEVGPLRLYGCHSWLLDPVLPTLVPGSNIAAFQSLWDLGETSPGDRDAYYFAFNIEPESGRELPYGLDELPTESRLHRAMVDHWRSGGHFTDVRGTTPIARYAQPEDEASDAGHGGGAAVSD
ncbi:acyltransferase domain-containing protein [Aestuariimicrobium kwangyangense]|uniref:acyltransferase domain-containing protein n=1 Tax=Aestuariimicrobium kwangyangense TaxID=396389 RepID=UPI0003F86B45|nr:acyltransferase domain-containing protein [Aestuariimicrobium kwangyangense]